MLNRFDTIITDKVFRLHLKYCHKSCIATTINNVDKGADDDTMGVHNYMHFNRAYVASCNNHDNTLQPFHPSCRPETKIRKEAVDKKSTRAVNLWLPPFSQEKQRENVAQERWKL